MKWRGTVNRSRVSVTFCSYGNIRIRHRELRDFLCRVFFHDYVDKVIADGRNARKDSQIAGRGNGNKNKLLGFLSFNRRCRSFAVTRRGFPDRHNYISAADRYRMKSTSLARRDVLFYVKKCRRVHHSTIKQRICQYLPPSDFYILSPSVQ